MFPGVRRLVLPSLVCKTADLQSCFFFMKEERMVFASYRTF